MQLGTVRFLGAFLDDPTAVPRLVVRCMADQLGLAADGHMEAYRASGWRRQHPAEIRRTYGYRTFAEPSVRFRLARWLYALCWTVSPTPRSSTWTRPVIPHKSS